MQTHGLAGLDVLVQAVGIVPRLTTADETVHVLDAVVVEDDRSSTGKRKRVNRGGGNRRKSPQPFKRLQALEVPSEVAAPKPQTKRQRTIAAGPELVPQPPYVAPANRDVATTEAEAWGAFIRSLGKGKRSEAMDRALELADTKMLKSVDEWIKFYQCSRRVQPLKLRAALNLALNLNQHITTVFPQKGTHPKVLDRDVRGLALHARMHPFTRAELAQARDALDGYERTEYEPPSPPPPAAEPTPRSGMDLDALAGALGVTDKLPPPKRPPPPPPPPKRPPPPPPVLATPAQPKYIVIDNAYWQRRDAWREKFAPAVRAIRRAAPALKTPLRISQSQQMLAMVDEDRATCMRAKDDTDIRRMEESIAWVMTMLREAVRRADARKNQPATPPASPPVTVAMPPPPPPPLLPLPAAAVSVSAIAR